MDTRKVLVTGGAGFIGVNTCARLLAQGRQVVVYDNLSRRGAELNLRWLRDQGAFTFVQADVRDGAMLAKVFSAHADISVVIHLAGQVAVTTSVQNPREDFEINALGTLNVLEAVRQGPARPLLIYASTNKVYGGMEDVDVQEKETRYAYQDFPDGIPETRLLDFHSPYGCSKGAADQYVHDYARIYGLSTVVMRQSCVYGPHQFGLEDQGWVAWFMIAVLLGRPITIYGDGKQVRDVLYVDDLVDAYCAAIARRDLVQGRIFNIGGGPTHTMSVWAEFGPLLENLHGRPIAVQHADWRPGDQPVYVSNIARARQELDWQPKLSVAEGVGKLYAWLRDNLEMVRQAV